MTTFFAKRGPLYVWAAVLFLAGLVLTLEARGEEAAVAGVTAPVDPNQPIVDGPDYTHPENLPGTGTIDRIFAWAHTPTGRLIFITLMIALIVEAFRRSLKPLRPGAESPPWAKAAILGFGFALGQGAVILGLLLPVLDSTVFAGISASAFAVYFGGEIVAVLKVAVRWGRNKVFERFGRKPPPDTELTPGPGPLAVLALMALVPALAFAQAQLTTVTAAQTGLSSAALSGSPQTAAIVMQNPQAPVSYNQLTLAWTVTAGTSTTMTVTCTASVEQGTSATFRPIERCADGSTFTCTAATWSYDLTTQTSGVINIPSNYWAIKCTFTATGSGLVTVTGVKNTI